MLPASARATALTVLSRVEESGAYANLLLDSLLDENPFGRRDKALATELTYGTLRWRGRVDWALSQFCHTPLEELDCTIRNILRLGGYQILFMRVPGFAAVHESVVLAKSRHGRAQGLVNAVLRRLLREKDRISYPNREDDWIGYMVHVWSHPEWLVRYWQKTLGAGETEELIRANDEIPSSVIRANTLRTTREQLIRSLTDRGISARPGSRAPEAIVLSQAGSVGLKNEGLWLSQSEPSQLITAIVDPQPGERILDTCAAPGGKSIHMADLMKNHGSIVAVDVHERGLGILRERAQRAGVTILTTIPADARTDMVPLRGQSFDRVLVDAPCTGLGTLRSHPDGKWNKTQDDITRLSQIQKEILRNAAVHLRKGGILVYSTCTLTREENEEVVRDFSRAFEDFEMQRCEAYLPSTCLDLVDAQGIFRTLPHRHGMDGFFAARFRRA